MFVTTKPVFSMFSILPLIDVGNVPIVYFMRTFTMEKLSNTIEKLLRALFQVLKYVQPY
jgi:hypothetical protein